MWEDLGDGGKILNYVVDALFGLDVILIFNSAYFDVNLDLVDDRCEVAKTYLKSWFIIDLVAIIPFEGFVPMNGEAANLVRFARIGRITKILKLLKLMRLMKLQKSGKFSLLSWIQSLFNISPDFKWMFSFICYFAMTTHVVACIWIIAAKMDPNPENSWISGYEEPRSKREIYLTSFYFTVTTITTVGYGDMPISTFLEKIIIIFVMIAGVIGFAMASGALTNYISRSDSKSEVYD